MILMGKSWKIYGFRFRFSQQNQSIDFHLFFFMFLSLLWFLFIHVVFVGHGWFSLVGGRGGWLVPDVFFGCLLIGRGRFLIYLDFRFAFSSSIGVTFSRFERWVVLCCLLVVPDLFVA